MELISFEITPPGWIVVAVIFAGVIY